MNKGTYIALSGAVLKHSQMEIISQNLANASSVGYKKDSLSFTDYLIPQESPGTDPDGRAMTDFSSMKTDFSSGDFVKTGNVFDIALDGEGFIALDGDRYMRRGDLKKDRDNYLTSFNGIRVLGKKGPIKLPDGSMEINSSGDIHVNGVLVDTIRTVKFTDPGDISKIGNGLFSIKGKGEKSFALVRQSYIETSNVDAVREMVSMINTLREFESFQKTIQAFDEASSKINNELGRF